MNSIRRFALGHLGTCLVGEITVCVIGYVCARFGIHGAVYHKPVVARGDIRECPVVISCLCPSALAGIVTDICHLGRQAVIYPYLRRSPVSGVVEVYEVLDCVLTVNRLLVGPFLDPYCGGMLFRRKNLQRVGFIQQVVLRFTGVVGGQRIE